MKDDLPARLAGAVEHAVGASAIVVLKHSAGLQDKSSRVAEQRIEREGCLNRRALRGACTIPIRGSRFAALVPLMAVDGGGARIEAALKPQIQRPELPFVRARDSDRVHRNLCGAAGRSSAMKNRPVHLCQAATRLEALKDRAAFELHFAAIRWSYPQRTAAPADRKLLPNKVFEAGELFLVQVAVSFADQEPISHLEAEGARRNKRERAAVAAWNVGFRLNQRGRIHGFGRSRPRANRRAEDNQHGKQDRQAYSETLKKAGSVRQGEARASAGAERNCHANKGTTNGLHAQSQGNRI